jgi:hypothetical protein
MTEQETLIKALEKQKKRLRAEREVEEQRKALALEIKDKKLLAEKDKIEKQISHRELFDQELREAIRIAAEKRVDATYSNLIDSVDKMKKHLNIIDGVGNGDTNNIIVIPAEIVSRYSNNKIENNNVINGESIEITPGTGRDSS